MMLLKYKNHLGLGLVLYDLLPDFEKYVSVNAIPMDANDVIILVRMTANLQFDPEFDPATNSFTSNSSKDFGKRLIKLGNKSES